METEQPVTQPPAHNVKSRNWKRILSMTLVGLILLAAGAGAGYMYRDNKAKTQAKVDAASFATALQNATKAAASAATAKTAAPAAPATAVTPSATVLANLADSIKSGNTAALEGYMAAQVTVIRAATDGGTNPNTPAQAVADVSYVTAAKGTWTFPATAANLAKYQAGFYKQYFPGTAYVGQSSDGYVISFQFDSSAKVSGIFMSVNASLLE